MRKSITQHLLVALMLWSSLSSFGHNGYTRCHSNEVLQRQLQEDPNMQQRMQQIEQSTNSFISQKASQRQTSNASANAVAATVTIPVVFHVLYNTSAQNVSDAMLINQIAVLNADYGGTNSDISGLPSAFSGIKAGNTGIQFCLAQRTPTGAATTGIVRKSTTKTSFSDNDGVKKSSSGGDDAWDATKYLNIWICNLGGGLLGYAQFPGGAAATDGVVALYSSLPGGTASPYNKGRTMTHEVGHWLNLRHIWGDATCGSDLVSDTPTQSTSNYGCPTFPHVTCSNGANGDLFQNYMDYTDDACMFMFSAGQSTRMNALFATGGARVGLVTSQGCVPPTTTTCGVPSGLAAASVTTASATVSWTAVSGATSYTLQYKTSAATTWTSVTGITTTSRALTGLTAGTTYNYQVLAVCSSGSSAYSTASSFTTTATTSCGTPTTLAAASVTSSGATLSWAAVSGATSYNVQYKLSSASTWTTTTSTTTSKALTGLTASSTYNYQVQAVCSATGAYSAASSFTTSAATTTCSDVYESNNSLSAAKTIVTNTSIKALIGTSSDKDYFKFVTTSAAKNIKVTLTNLPKDYDVKLYNSAGTLLATSQNGSTTAESITYNNGAAGTYYVYVYGYSSAYSATACYTLLASTSAATFREMAPVVSEKDNIAKGATISIYPNPTTGEFSVKYLSDGEKRVAITIFDLSGKAIKSDVFDTTEGENVRNVTFDDAANGMYLININDGESNTVQKITLNR